MQPHWGSGEGQKHTQHHARKCDHQTGPNARGIALSFESHCSVMEQMQDDISKNNSEAADWRTKALLAQQEIKVCEINMPQIN
jgi:hypothetical protein